METLEVHSKDFLVKWIHAPDNSVIDWQAKPLKKSINFAIYKKDESSNDTKPPAPRFLSNDSSQGSSNGVPSSVGTASSKPSSSGSNGSSPNEASTANGSSSGRRRSNSGSNGRLRSTSVVSVNEVSESVSSIYKTLSRSNTRTGSFSNNLTNSDLTLVKDYKKLVSGELVHGKFEVKQGGIYAFIFDNSFSKTIGKKILFSTKIIQTQRPLSTIPQDSSTSIPKKFESKTSKVNSDSTTSVSSIATATSTLSTSQNHNGSSSSPSNSFASYSLGNQGVASSGASTPSRARKTPSNSNRDLESILRPKNGELLQGTLLKRRRKKLQGFTKRFFVLNFKYGTLSYFKINDNKLRGQMPIKLSIVSANAKNREIIIDSGMEAWDLKASSPEVFKSWVEAFNQIKREHYEIKDTEQNAGFIKESSELNSPPAATNQYVNNSLEKVLEKLALLKSELVKSSSIEIVDDINNDISKVINHLQSNDDDQSNFSNGDFYDAKEYLDAINSGVVFLNEVGPKASDSNSEEASGKSAIVKPTTKLSDDGAIDPLATAGKTLSKPSDEEDDEFDDEISTSSDDEDDESAIEISVVKTMSVSEDNDLYPLPIDTPIKRDYTIPICEHSPPSILAFLRKNVGKDLSSVAMPVTMNEPLSTLQKYSEMMEYCEIINNALQANCDAATGERILRIAAFAVSSLSSMRAKERNVRKPFTPLLGETYELVREDFGIRIVTEKVIHRPPVYAIFVESKDWEFNFSPSPEQKFWGKNAEIITRGTAKLTIKETGEVFSWTQPSTLLKNIIAGEKYGEPSTTLTIKSSFGYKAVVEFAKGGMFSGRSEDLTIKAFNLQNKKQLPYVVGKWTDSLTLKTNTTERLIWTVGDLLPNPTKQFGFTKFAGTLNKITEIEKGKIPPTDSRLRPDLKIYENGEVDEAEDLKLELEEQQRVRRKEMEAANVKHTPKFFHQVSADNDTEWTYITGEKSYWNRRKTGDWQDLPKLW